MLIDQDSISELDTGLLDFFIGHSLDLNVTVKSILDKYVCYVDGKEYNPSTNLDYTQSVIIPMLIVQDGYNIRYTIERRGYECVIANKDIGFYGYGGCLSSSLCRALVLLNYNEKFVEIKYDMVIH